MQLQLQCFSPEHVGKPELRVGGWFQPTGCWVSQKKRNPREPVKNIPEIKIAGKMKFRKILFYRWDIFMFQENSGTNWVGTIRSWWFVQKSGKLTHHLRLVVEIPLFRTGIKIHPKVFSLGISEWTLVRTGPYLAGPVTELRPWRICVPVLKRYLGWWWGSERPRFVVDVGDLLGMKKLPYVMWGLWIMNHEIFGSLFSTTRMTHGE